MKGSGGLAWQRKFTDIAMVALHVPDVDQSQEQFWAKFPCGNPTQRIHIDIVRPLPLTQRENRDTLTIQCRLTKWTEAFSVPNQRATHLCKGAS